MPPATPYPYYPPKTLVRTQTQIVREVDPEWRPAMTGEEVEYEFSRGRQFKARPRDRHPYNIPEE